MKRIFVILLVISVVVVSGVFLNQFVPMQLAHKAEMEMDGNVDNAEEKPEVIISAEEEAINQQHIDNYFKNKVKFKSSSAVSSYADGQINGTWEQFRFLTYSGSPYGFRTVGSVYDQYNDVIYAIPSTGHLWKINREVGNNSNTNWELINHKENFITYIDGLNKTDGSFRMIRSSDYRMQYSDNEGRDWTNATGVQSTQKTYEGAIVKTESGNKIFVLVKTSSSNVQVYVSTDDGVTYSALSTKFNPSSYYVKLFRVHNSESVFLAAYNNSNSKVSIYEHEVDAQDFTLVNTSTSTFVSLDNIFGTYYDGNYHFYVATKNTHIYYTSDKGATWSLKQITSESGNTNCREVHPSKPNVLFRGYLDVYVSTNYGTSFSNFGHRLGWDVHHMKFYQRKNNTYFFFLGKDFGCYTSDNPELWSSYISLNNTAPAQMCYDADHGQNYNSSFTATQDRGTVGFMNSTNESATTDVRTTDGLRVTLANNDASVWTWMYFGTMYHKSNFAARPSSLASLNWTGNWWAAPIIPSPNVNEDAVYVAAGSRLKKFTFNPEKESIVETDHYYDFQSETGSEITGFGYSTLNPKRWYVSVKNGKFFYSENGGQTFEQTSYTGTLPRANDQYYNFHKNQHVIKASNLNEEKVYYAGVGNAFLISNDGGKTFTNHNAGLSAYRIRDFDFSEDEKFIYAACGSGGIWVFSVERNRWYVMNDEPVPIVDFTDVEFMKKQNAVKFATYGSGVLTFNIEGEYQTIVYPDNLSAELSNETSVLLQWEDNSDNEDGFKIERSNNGTFTQIASVAANQVSFTDSNIPQSGNFQYRVKAFNSSDESYYSNYSMIDVPAAGEVSKNDWKLVSVNSQAINGYGAALAFDGDPSTMWHTDWTASPVPSHPHTLVIDMNKTHNLYGFSYLSRRDNNWNGTISRYEFYVSTNNSNWTKVASGTWAKTWDVKEVMFSSPTQARYIKLVALSEVNGGALASCAELSVMNQVPQPKTPKAPQFVQGGRLSDAEIELIWLDMSGDENGYTIEQFVNGSFTPIYTSGQNVTTYKLQNTSINKSYTFRVIAFNDIGKSEYSEPLTINAVWATSISEKYIEDNAIKVYPNPSSDYINLDLSLSARYYNWQIVDLSGKLLKQGTIGNNNKETISVQKLRAGTYVLKLSGDNAFTSKTFIKK